MSQDYCHDPVLCQSPVCSWCDAFNYGHAVGKAKAHFELRSLDRDPLRSTETSRARPRAS